MRLGRVLASLLTSLSSCTNPADYAETLGLIRSLEGNRITRIEPETAKKLQGEVRTIYAEDIKKIGDLQTEKDRLNRLFSAIQKYVVYISAPENQFERADFFWEGKNIEIIKKMTDAKSHAEELTELRRILPLDNEFHAFAAQLRNYLDQVLRIQDWRQNPSGHMDDLSDWHLAQNLMRSLSLIQSGVSLARNSVQKRIIKINKEWQFLSQKLSNMQAEYRNAMTLVR